ncbi:MAG: hypothetical protein HN742_28055 [Lentisphaerae bacterium]|nr:hypothetical protein [Lentisphaerota bacterium]MBT4816937.1 hypothetical protein [Lentisphaerota bacterium]MBT7053996.1 hypothetical protein [Lentisphaerota bacterium]MBT7845759.1 hypothetical protein [Lentisphaerota bacterium]
MLKAELLPPSADPVAGERITLKLKITNVSPEPVDLPWPRFIDQFITSVQRASDGTVTRVAHTGLALGHGKYPGGLLQPSESMSVDLTHVFDAPGVHRVKCELRTTREACPWWSFWEGCVDTEELRVAVRGKGADNE